MTLRSIAPLIAIVLSLSCGGSGPSRNRDDSGGGSGRSTSGEGGAPAAAGDGTGGGASAVGGATDAGGQSTSLGGGATSGRDGSSERGAPADPPCANLARNAALEAQTRFPDYALADVTDGDRDTTLGSGHSWANYWDPPRVGLPQWFDLDFGRSRAVSRVEIHTSQGYALQDYDLLYWDGANWRLIVEIRGNPVLHRTHEFSTVATNRLRILCRKGPQNQTFHVRLNEVEVYSVPASECPGGSTGSNEGEPPGVPVLPARSVGSELKLVEVACDPNEPRWSCQGIDGKTNPSCTYRNFQATREFEARPVQDGQDPRIWPGALVRDFDVNGSSFEAWVPQRSELAFSLTYPTSHHVEMGTMAAPAGRDAFITAARSILGRREGIPIPIAVEAEIAPLRDGEEFEALTGYSITLEPLASALSSFDFGTAGDGSVLLLTLTARHFDVEVALPSSVSELLVDGSDNPALADPSAPSDPALIRKVSFGKRTFIVVDTAGPFEQASAWFRNVVGAVALGSESSLSEDDVRRFELLDMRVWDSSSEIWSPMYSISSLKAILGASRTFSGVHDVISYELVDLDGNTQPGVATARFVEARCDGRDLAFEVSLENVQMLGLESVESVGLSGSVSLGRRAANGACVAGATGSSDGELTFSWKGTPVRNTIARQFYETGDSVCLRASVRKTANGTTTNLEPAALSLPITASVDGRRELTVGSPDDAVRLSIELFSY